MDVNLVTPKLYTYHIANYVFILVEKFKFGQSGNATMYREHCTSLWSGKNHGAAGYKCEIDVRSFNGERSAMRRRLSCL